MSYLGFWFYNLAPETDREEFRQKALAFVRDIQGATGLINVSLAEGLPPLQNCPPSRADFVIAELWEDEEAREAWRTDVMVNAHTAPTMREWVWKHIQLHQLASEAYEGYSIVPDIYEVGYTEKKDHSTLSPEEERGDLMTLSIDDLKAQVVETAKRASRLRLIPATHGNFSARDSASDLVFITPSQWPYEELTPDDVITVDVHGKVLDGKHEPSSETAVHCRVYDRRPDINGVVHVEPRYTNGFGLVGREIPPVITTLYLAIGGSVPVAPFVPSGSAEFADTALEAMGDRFGVIWANHGLMTVGHSLPLALHRAEIIEHCAASYYFAVQMGEPSLLPLETLHEPLV